MPNSEDDQSKNNSSEEPSDSFRVEGSEKAMEDALKSLETLEKGKKSPNDPNKKKGEEFSSQNLDQLSSLMKKKDERLQEARDRLLRVSADFDNYKKRVKKEQEDAILFGKENYLRGLLTIIDSFERTLVHSNESIDVKTLLEGVELIYKQTLSYLQDLQVVPIESLGKPFDPKFHEALSQEETEEVPHMHVLREMERGYLLKNKLLRPAKVVVASNPNAEKDSKNSESPPLKC